MSLLIHSSTNARELLSHFEHFYELLILHFKLYVRRSQLKSRLKFDS